MISIAKLEGLAFLHSLFKPPSKFAEVPILAIVVLLFVLVIFATLEVLSSCNPGTPFLCQFLFLVASFSLGFLFSFVPFVERFCSNRSQLRGGRELMSRRFEVLFESNLFFLVLYFLLRFQYVAWRQGMPINTFIACGVSL